MFPSTKFMQLDPSNQELVNTAEKGEVISLVVLSEYLFEEENGFHKDIFLGVKYLKLAIKQKSKEAKEKYAEMLLKGDKILQDEKKGVKLMKGLMKKGSSTACYKLGLYEKGRKPPNLIDAKKTL